MLPRIGVLGTAVKTFIFPYVSMWIVCYFGGQLFSTTSLIVNLFVRVVFFAILSRTLCLQSVSIWPVVSHYADCTRMCLLTQGPSHNRKSNHGCYSQKCVCFYTRVLPHNRECNHCQYRQVCVHVCKC